MGKISLNDFQTKIFEDIKKYLESDHRQLIISHQKTRISFKKGRFNYYILFPRKGIMTLHVNLRKYTSENNFAGFQSKCFNNAKQYIEIDLHSSDAMNKILDKLQTLN